MKKHSQEYIEKYFKDNDCKLLSFYKNAKTKMKYKCSCGNISYINFDKFRQGCRCMKCSGTPKYSQKYVSQYFRDNNCELLGIYKKSHDPVKYICKCGNISKISFSNFKNGKRCMKCANKYRSIIKSGRKNHNWIIDREYIKLKERVRSLSKSLIRHSLKSTGQLKNTKTYKLLGYSGEDLLNHLRKDPLFDAWKEDSYHYHVDHIIPVKAFVENGITDPKVINSLDNLQLLSAKENLSKQGKYNSTQFKNYVEEKV